MALALMSIVVTLAYLGLAGSNLETAKTAGPLYVGLVLALWWAGRREDDHRELP